MVDSKLADTESKALEQRNDILLDEREAAKDKFPVFRENEDGGLVLDVKNSEELTTFTEVLGAKDHKVAVDRLTSLVHSDPRGYSQSYRAEILTKRMAAMNPQDEIEATLMAQMVTLDEQFRWLIAVGNHDENDGEVRNKCRGLALRMTREYGEHVKVLTRYRSGGEQVVRHVHVHEGGQAAFIER